MINRYSTLRHYILKVAVQYGIPDVEEHCIEDHILRIVRTLKINHLSRPRRKVWIIPQSYKACDRTLGGTKQLDQDAIIQIKLSKELVYAIIK